ADVSSYGSEIQLPITVEVANSNPLRRGSDRDLARRLKSTVAIAQQNVDTAITVVRQREIQFPVTIEIAGHNHAPGISAHRRDHGSCAKSSITVIEQYTQAAVIVRDQRVEVAVVSQISQSNATWGLRRAGGIEDWRLECAIAISQEYGDLGIGFVDNANQINLAIAIDVASLYIV